MNYQVYVQLFYDIFKLDLAHQDDKKIVDYMDKLVHDFNNELQKKNTDEEFVKTYKKHKDKFTLINTELTKKLGFKPLTDNAFYICVSNYGIKHLLTKLNIVD